jgi:hypothetical protein
VCAIIILTLLLNKSEVPRPNFNFAGSNPAILEKIQKLQDSVNQLSMGKPQLSTGTSKEVALSISKLAYEYSSPAIWARRFEYRNAQVERFNTVPLGSENGGLKKFFQEHWEPTFSCTFPTRLGNIGDGGKWVCNPLDILASAKSQSRNVLIYSLGSNSEYSFETAISNTFAGNHEIHTFDMGAPVVTVPSFINFHQWKMVGDAEDGVGNARSLTTIRKTLGHTGKTIDIFKIDIEGSEYEVLKTFMTKEGGCLLDANMVLMETHWGSPRDYNDLFQRLTTICGFELYYKEPNIEYSKGEVLEWCFVKVDWNAIPK